MHISHSNNPFSVIAHDPCMSNVTEHQLIIRLEVFSVKEGSCAIMALSVHIGIAYCERLWARKSVLNREADINECM